MAKATSPFASSFAVARVFHVAVLTSSVFVVTIVSACSLTLWPLWAGLKCAVAFAWVPEALLAIGSRTPPGSGGAARAPGPPALSASTTPMASAALAAVFGRTFIGPKPPQATGLGVLRMVTGFVHQERRMHKVDVAERACGGSSRTASGRGRDLPGADQYGRGRPGRSSRPPSSGRLRRPRRDVLDTEVDGDPTLPGDRDVLVGAGGRAREPQ